MRKLFNALSTILFLLAIFIGQILCINVLPYPFNHIDVVFVILWWQIFLRPSPQVWWMLVVLGLTTELYSSSPFGITTIALFLSLNIGNWLLIRVFTSHAWHVILLSTACTLILYHTIFLVMLFVHHSILGIAWNLSGPFFASTAIGIGLSVTLMLVVYSFGRLYNRRLKTSYTSLKYL